MTIKLVDILLLVNRGNYVIPTAIFHFLSSLCASHENLSQPASFISVLILNRAEGSAERIEKGEVM